jgi:hypothetical protein
MRAKWPTEQTTVRRVAASMLRDHRGCLATGAVIASWFVIGVASAGAHHVEASYPNSIVAMGHSGLTGWNSDPKKPGLDAPQNSWATGANPAVNSIYRRILTLNEGMRDHAYNLAVSGSKVDDVLRQADEAARLPVKPELVIIQSIDNDMRCDGTDAQNYKPFGATLARALDIVVASNPDVQIFIVNQWATAKNFATVARTIPDQRTTLSENGPCGLLKPSGKLRRAGIASYERILAGYYRQIKVVCARLAHCSTDHNALHRMVIQRSDLASDGGHLSVRGQRKMAAVAWQASIAAFTRPSSQRSATISP